MSCLNNICLIIDFKGFNIKRLGGFLIRELGFCSLTNETHGSYKFNLNRFVNELTREDWKRISYVRINGHGLSFRISPRENKFLAIESLNGAINYLYNKNKTETRNLVAFKGGHVEKDKLEELNIPYVDIEKFGCPKYDNLPRVRDNLNCGEHITSLSGKLLHCPIQETFALKLWIEENLKQIQPLWNVSHQYMPCEDNFYLHFQYGILYPPEQAMIYFNLLEEQISYLNDAHVYGKHYSMPRSMVAYGDEGLTYTFSGLHAKPWIPVLLNIKSKVEQVTGENFNFVLINRYKDGNDKISPYKDNEADLDSEASIATVSFGAERKFSFSKPKFKSISLNLENGSLLLIKYPTNKYWSHAIPLSKSVMNPRVSLTFRKMVKK